MNNAYIMTIETRIDHLIQQVLVDDTDVVDALADDAVSGSAGEVVIE
jgi:hypothetical protein